MKETDKELTTFRKVGLIKGQTTGGYPAKTLLHLGIQNGVKTVILKQYALTDEEMPHWEPVKKFKGVILYLHIIHIRLDTFMATAKVINRSACDVYRKIEVYMARDKEATK